MTRAEKAMEQVQHPMGYDILDRLMEIAERFRDGDGWPDQFDAVVEAADQLAEDMGMDSWVMARKQGRNQP